MKQFYCAGGNDCCGGTEFEVYEDQYDILKLVCTRCSAETRIEFDVQQSVHGPET